MKTVAKQRKADPIEAHLKRVRAICASMPSSTEKLSHGAPTFFADKDKKVFAVFAGNHHNDGRIALWLAAPPGLQPALINDAPETYFRPPYVGSAGWIGIELEHIDDEALAVHIQESWRLVAPKKKTAGRSRRGK
jgi:hypothetical protein